MNRPEHRTTNAERVCAECGSTVFADAPQGVCSVCLFRTGFASDDVEAFGPTVGRILKDFGDYELLEEIGRGGQGVVYRARQKSLNRMVALKVIGLAHWATEAHVKRFRLEAEAAAQLDDPHIVPIYEIGERDGACYFSMKLIEGGQLDKIIGSEPMPLRKAAELTAKLARTLDYAHQHGILHRDIKPGNILLDRKGEPHLTDFGLARLVETESNITRTSEVLGTPSYMAPEQAAGNKAPLTSATDVYGLGAVLYQLLTGHPPFAGGTTYETIKLLLETEPQQPRLLNRQLDRDLATVCSKCLEKDPQRRYLSALALAEDLERWLRHEPIRARRAGIFGYGKKWLRRNPTTAGLVTLLVGLLAIMGVIIRKSDLVSPPKATGVAVLPFQNLSHDPNDAYFTDGVQDEILTRLSKIADLKVISRTSTQRFTSTPADVREIARKLGVTHVVEGSVQKVNDQVRVNVQLINALTDAHLWAETYNRKLTDIFAVESDIAKTIAGTLQAKLSGSEKTAMSNKPTNNQEAYELYLKGRFFWNKRTAADMLKAADYYNQAIAKDPNYALAYAGLAESYVVFQDYGVSSPAESIPRAKDAAIKALSLNDALAEPHAALGLAYAYYDCDAAKSIAEFERAIQLNPNYATAHQWYSMPWQMVGQFDRAIAEGKRAIELDPLSLIANSDLAFAYLTARRFDEALAQSRKTLGIDPGFHVARGYLAEALQFKGQLSEAIAEYHKANESIDEPDWLARLGQALARAGHRDEAQKILAHLVEKRRTQFVSGYSVALVYLGLGDKTHAIDALETGVAQHVSEIPLIKYDPRLDELHGELHFQALVQKVLGSEAEPPAVTPSPTGVAVLPFVNLSPDKENDYLSDGITEDLCTVLSQIKGLRVPARTSSFAFKGKTEDIRSIGKALNVSTVLEGSVAKSGNKLRINAQLNNVADGYHLWAATYDREVTDILEIRSEISRRVADALKVQLGIEEKERLEKKPTENPEAHELYLKGRFFWNKRTGADLKKAIRYFEQAISKDPNDALAYAGLADAYVLFTNFTVAAPSESFPHAEAAARKALELDDSLAEAHTSLGEVLWEYYLDATGSTKEFERAIALNPNYATAHHWYGVGPLELGDSEKSIAELKCALELDPLSLIINADLGGRLVNMRRYDEAIAQLRKTLEMDSHFYFAHWQLGEALQLKGKLNEAIAEYKKATELDDDPYVLGSLAQAHARAGQRDEALKLLTQLQQIATRRWVPNYVFALVHTALGEKDRAIDDLERAYREHDFSDLSYIRSDALLDPLRGDPRFEALAQKILPSKAEPTSGAPLSPSIAVLPFVNMSPDKENDYLADGIQEEILTSLSKIAGLKVISRTSMQRFKSAPINLREVAQQLGVANVLEGSVQKAADQVRVSVQLISTQNDSHLWAETYDRKLTDIFAVESDIAKMVAETLRAKLTGSAEKVLASRPTENPEAHQLYLKGRYFWNRRTEENLNKAIACFQQAIEKDPSYALAYAALADCYGVMPYYVNRPPKDEIERGKEAARRAIQLDESLGEAHTALASLLMNDLQLAAAEAEFKRALVLNSNYATAHQWYGDCLYSMDRLNEALTEARRAQELDPLSLVINCVYAAIFDATGHYDEALKQAHSVIELDPDFTFVYWIRGQIFENHGAFDKAVADYEKAKGSLPRAACDAMIGCIYARMGRTADARKILDQLLDESQQTYVPSYFLADIQAMLGNKEEALRLLERAYDERSIRIGTGGLGGPRTDKRLDSLRGEARFEALVQKVLTSRAEPASEPGPPTGVAVLPFVNMSPDKDNDYLSDGITEDLCTVLSQIKGLRVPPGSSSFFFKGKTGDIRAVGEALNVSTVLEGSIIKSGNKLRISAQLNNVADGYHLWAATYDREMSDILEIRSDISRHVADALKVQLGVEEKRGLEKKPTESPEAHELYLKGRFFWNKRTGADLKKAIQYFEQAIGKDPNYALAYADLAEVYVMLPDWGTETSTEHYYALARSAAEKAVGYDPTLPEAHIALALAVRHEDRDFARAEQELGRAIQLSPRSATAHYYLGYLVYTPQGDFEHALPEIKCAAELDPLNATTQANYANLYLLARHYLEAIAQSQKTLELEPNSFPALNSLGMALLLNGRTDEGIQAFKRPYSIGSRYHSLASLAYAYARKGDSTQALQMLGQLEELENQGKHPSPLGHAMIYAALGDKDQAMQWLERGAAENDSGVINNIKVLPMLDPLRGDARFERLLTELVPPPRPKSDSRVVTAVSLAREAGDASQKRQATTYGVNLLVNGGAEEGAASVRAALVPVPGWSTTGGFTVVPYGAPEGYPTVSEAPPNGMKQFFTGGRDAVSTAIQEIEISSNASDIDAGTVVCDISAWLGGYFDQDDEATLTVEFRNNAARNLKTVRLGPVTALERAKQTGFKFRNSSVSVPAQTRIIHVELVLTRKPGAGSCNDGYADNLSVILRVAAGS